MASAVRANSELRNDIYNIYLSIGFELKKHLRRRRLLIVTAMAVLVPLLFYISVPDTAIDFVSISMNFVSVLIIVSGAMFGSDAICGEFENKTALLSFATPQKRSSIFIGKYIATLMAAIMAVSLYYLVTILQISHLYGVGEIPSELGESFLSALIYTTSVVSVVFLFSSILKRSISATILGFISLMMVLPVVSMVISTMDVEPWFIVTYSAGLITSVFGEGITVLGPGGHQGSTTFEPDLGLGIIVMLTYMIAGFVSSITIANRKSVE